MARRPGSRQFHIDMNRDASTIVLSSDEYNFFLNALAEDRKPSKRSRAAAKRYRRAHRKGVRYHVNRTRPV